MIIAITAKGGTLDTPVDPRFGRAKSLLLHDTETDKCRRVDNTQNMTAAQGAGIQTAQNVADAGAEVVITGHCGPKAFRTLQAAGIAVVVGASGTAADALTDYRNGTLVPTQAPDVESHSG
ncbi:MAG: NifB/NifX family molybdenum-iron cluster-binding protein [Candidatus Pacebacteria bacterium]|nr:NifB/NifX family molybdenum-iron cluster-binding protein [Candidatus Paceibacterota bacterium]